MEQFDALVLRLELPGGDPSFWIRPAAVTPSASAPVRRTTGVSSSAAPGRFAGYRRGNRFGNRADNRLTIRLDAAGGAEIEAVADLRGRSPPGPGAAGPAVPEEREAALRELASAGPPAPCQAAAGGRAWMRPTAAWNSRAVGRGDLTVRQKNVVVLDTPSHPLTFAEVSFWLGEPERTPLDLGEPTVTVTESSCPRGARCFTCRRRSFARRPPGPPGGPSVWTRPGAWSGWRGVAVTRRILPPADYAETRRFFEAFTARAAGLILYRMPAAGAPDLRGGR